MGIGARVNNHQQDNGRILYAPVSYKGDIESGNIGGRDTSMKADGHAEGGNFDMSLKIPMPGDKKKMLMNLNTQQVNLQNLAWIENGQLHTVQQPANYNGRPLLGSTYQPSL